MGQLGFIYENSKCIGCRACQVACKEKNKLNADNFFRRVDTISYEHKLLHFSVGCNHCESPACVSECPTNAMYILADSTVAHDKHKCIGCGACTWACPYGAVKFSSKQGFAIKCDSCKDLREDGQKPACVTACLTRCLDFDNVDHIQGNEHPNFLPEKCLTHPSLKLIGRNVK